MKASTPKGVRDFSCDQVYKRSYIIDIFKKKVEQFGFIPIETSAFENLETLIQENNNSNNHMIFRILNSGNILEKINNKNTNKLNSNICIKDICEKALRYDLTVPFSRFIAMNYSNLVLPFKRYQIQPVWRAERPQKGRFREFYQCDIDIVGSNSIYLELELIILYDLFFSEINLPVTIQLNNRKILTGIAEVSGIIDHSLFDFISILDKLDKVGEKEVIKEMQIKGISDKSIKSIYPIFKLKKENNNKKLAIIKNILQKSTIGKTGIEELEFLLNYIQKYNLIKTDIEFNCTLARGFNYYTGNIFEVITKYIKLGSISGGGRYDNLTELFDLKGVSGVGISFGLDRIYLAMEELNLFPNFGISPARDYLFINFGEKESLIAFKIIQNLRKNGKICELYPDQVKLTKQFKYAEKKKYQNIIFLGSNEINNQEIKIKNISSGITMNYKWNKRFEIVFF